MKNTIGLRFKTALTFAVILFFIVVLAISFHGFTQHSIQLLVRSYEMTIPSLEILDQSLVKIREQQQLSTEAVSSNDEYALNDAKNISIDVTSRLREIAVMDQSNFSETYDIIAMYRSYSEGSEQIYRSILRGEMRLNASNEIVDGTLAANKSTVSRITTLRDRIHKSYLSDILSMQTTNQRNMKLGLTFIGFIALCCGMFVLILQNEVITPIVKIAETSRLASLGQFRKIDGITGKGEIALLGKNFNEMIESLSATSRKVNAIINASRQICQSTDLRMLFDNVESAVNNISDSKVELEIFILSKLSSREIVDDHFQMFDSKGLYPSKIVMEEASALENAVPLYSNIDGEMIGIIHLKKELNDEKLLLIEFINAIAISVVSSLESMKLYDTLDLVKIQREEILLNSQKIENTLLLVQSQAAQINAIFENINQGICLFNRELKIVGTYSPYLETFLGRGTLNEADIIDEMFFDSSISSEKLSMLKSGLLASFDEDLEIFDFNRHVLIENAEVYSSGTSRFIEAEWIPLSSGNCSNVTSLIMLVVRDVTELRSFQREKEQMTKESSLINLIVNIQEEIFEQTIKVCDSIAIRLGKEKLLGYSTAEYQALRNDLHTMKGVLRSHGLEGMSNSIHNIEDLVKTDPSRSTEMDNDRQEKIEQLLITLVEDTRYLKDLFYIKLKRRRSDRGVILESAALNLFESMRERHAAATANDLIRDRVIFHQTWKMHKYSHINLLEQLQNQAFETIKYLSLDSVIKVEWSGSALSLRRETFSHLSDLFGHMIRNAIFHSLSEAKVGTIHIICATSRTGRCVFRLYSTGKGLNLVKLQSIGTAKGLLSDSSDNETIASLILQNEVSTSNVVNEIAGRGNGLAAVVQICNTLNGYCEVKLLSAMNPQSASFEFVLDVDLNVSFSAG